MFPPGSSRRFPRLEKRLQVQLEVLQTRQVYHEGILDVSQGGVRITCQSEISPGTAVAIRAIDMLYLGEIVWQACGMAGVKFDQVLDLKDLARIMQEY